MRLPVARRRRAKGSCPLPDRTPFQDEIRHDVEAEPGCRTDTLGTLHAHHEMASYYEAERSPSRSGTQTGSTAGPCVQNARASGRNRRLRSKIRGRSGAPVNIPYCHTAHVASQRRDRMQQLIALRDNRGSLNGAPDRPWILLRNRRFLATLGP